jgi:hypothetical protein
MRAALATERHEPVEPTSRAPKPGEAGTQGATSSETTTLLFHEAGKALPVAEVRRLRSKRLTVIADHLTQDARRGLPWLARRRWRGYARPSAVPKPRRASPETWGCSGDSVSGKAVSAHVIGTAGGSRSNDPFVRPGQASRPRRAGDRADLRGRADGDQTVGSSRCSRMTNLGQHRLEI